MPEILGLGLLGDVGAFGAADALGAGALAGGAADIGLGAAGLGAADVGLGGALAGGAADIGAAGAGIDTALASGAADALSGLGPSVVDTAGTFGTDISGLGAGLGPLGEAATGVPLDVTGGVLGPAAGSAFDALPAASDLGGAFGDLGGALGVPGAGTAADISSSLAAGLPGGATAADVAAGLPAAGGVVDPFSGAFAGGLPSTDPFAGTVFGAPANPATAGVPGAALGSTAPISGGPFSDIAASAFPGGAGPFSPVSTDFGTIPSGGISSVPETGLSGGFTSVPETLGVPQNSLIPNVSTQEAAQTGFGDSGFVTNNISTPSAINPQTGGTGFNVADVSGTPNLPSSAATENFATSVPTSTVSPTSPVSADVASVAGPGPSGATTGGFDVGTPGAPTNFSLANVNSAISGGGGAFTDFLAKNPMLALGGAGLALNVARQFMPTPDEQALKNLAAQLQSNSAQANANAQSLINPLISGQLPGPQAAQVQQALSDAVQVIKARHVQDPGSTAEAAEIANAIQQSIVASGQLESQMASAGISLASQATNALNVESSIFQFLSGEQINLQNAFGQAIANFTGQAAIAQAISGIKSQ